MYDREIASHYLTQNPARNKHFLFATALYLPFVEYRQTERQHAHAAIFNDNIIRFYLIHKSSSLLNC